MLEQQQTPSGAEPVRGLRDGTEALNATAQPAVPQSESLVSESLLPDPRAVPRRESMLSGAYRDPFIWVTSLAVFGAYLAISLFRLLQLKPSSWDLAIYTEYVRQSASLHTPVADVRTAGFNLLGDHFQPIVMVIAPLFRVFPSPATLVAMQALLAALSVFGVSQAAREKFGGSGTGPSRAIAVAYGFSWGLQQMANFDFHEIAFAVPLLAFSLSALVRGRIRLRSGGRSRWSSSRRIRASRWPPSACTWRSPACALPPTRPPESTLESRPRIPPAGGA